MAMQFNKVFFGDTPSNQRKYIAAVFRFLKDKYPKLILPACGQFSLAKCAIEAGYEKKNIFASDISLYSSLLGYLYSGKPVEDLKFVLAEDYRDRYAKCGSDIEKAAHLVWIMKTKQINTKVFYEKLVFDDLTGRMEFHIKNIAEKLERFRTYYSGINYEIADMREILTIAQAPDVLVVVNPPVFRNGYTKMFNFENAILWGSGVPEFDFKREYRPVYEQTRAMPTPYLWYRFRSVEGFEASEVIYCKEYDIDKRDYWLLTKPDELKDFKYQYMADFMTEMGVKAYSAPIFTNEDELTYDSKISFVSVTEQQAMYYRDLFAHKLGNTSAEQYYLMLIDGKIFATVGFMTSKLFRLQSDRIFENYGFSAPVKNLPRANRLLMLAITCKDFTKFIYDNASRINRIYRLKGLRTTCLSKYRKVKLNNGILKVLKCEKIPEGKSNGGMYKILYDTEFHDLTFADVVKKFLDEEKSVLQIKAAEVSA